MTEERIEILNDTYPHYYFQMFEKKKMQLKMPLIYLISNINFKKALIKNV